MGSGDDELRLLLLTDLDIPMGAERGNCVAQLQAYERNKYTSQNLRHVSEEAERHNSLALYRSSARSAGNLDTGPY